MAVYAYLLVYEATHDHVDVLAALADGTEWSPVCIRSIHCSPVLADLNGLFSDLQSSIFWSHSHPEPIAYMIHF